MNNLIESGSAEVSIENGVGYLTFYHPQSNSLPGKLLNNIAELINELGKNNSVLVIVLQSKSDVLPNGKSAPFCAGASFDELIAIKDMQSGKAFFSGFAKVINAIRKCPKFVIARVHGKAVGGGVGVACAADYAVGTKHSSVKLSELAVGIGPFVVGPAVERKVGKSAFCQLTINATEWQSAQWAREKGIFTEIYETTAEMDAAITALAGQLTASNPEAMALLKKVFWEGTENWDQLLLDRAEMSGKLVISDFTRNAINKFKAASNK